MVVVVRFTIGDPNIDMDDILYQEEWGYLKFRIYRGGEVSIRILDYLVRIADPETGG